MALDHLKDLFAQVVLRQQVSEGQHRGLVRDPVAEQFDHRKPPHRRNLDEDILHRWITEQIRLQHQVDPQHGG